MTPKFKFADGEKVLCFHGPLIYEAKLLKSQVTKDKQIKYFIHYAGWNKNWDEWVPENRVLKYNEQNCQRQKEVSKQHAAASKNNRKSTAKGKKGDGDSRASTPSKESGSSTPTVPSRVRGSKSASKNSTDTPEEEAPKKKRGRADTSITTTNTPTSNNTSTLTTNNSSTVEDEEEYQLKIEVKIKLPDELKQILVDDWDCINRQRKLLEIPAKITVEDILENYVAFKKQENKKLANVNNIRTDITAGLIEYFNVMLGSQLLYKFERPQYSEVLQAHPNTPMCKLYGAYHFLRLFVNLGKTLAYTALDPKYIQTLYDNLNDIFKYLIKNSSQYFDLKNFINSSPEYHRRTQ